MARSTSWCLHLRSHSSFTLLSSTKHLLDISIDLSLFANVVVSSIKIHLGIHLMMVHEVVLDIPIRRNSNRGKILKCDDCWVNYFLLGFCRIITSWVLSMTFVIGPFSLSWSFLKALSIFPHFLMLVLHFEFKCGGSGR
jgi:hypothetical protein